MKKFIVYLLLFTASVAVGKKFYDNLDVQGNITLTGTVDGRDVDADGTTLDGLNTVLGPITSGESTQLQNIDSNTISNGQWGFLGAMDQGIAIADSPTFATLGSTAALLIDQIATPSNPASGKNKFYFKSDDNLYKLNNTGTESRVGGGDGGAKNYIENNAFESTTEGTSVFEDAGGVYVDGTGGSPTTITRTINPTTPLNDLADLKITKAATDGSNEGITIISKTIDIADRGRSLVVKFEWDGRDVDYTSGDYKLNSFGLGNNGILNLFCLGGCLDDGSLPNLKTKVTYQLVTKETTTSIRLSIHLASDSSTGTANDVFLDNIVLGPEGVVPGAIITNPVSFTPSFTNFTLGNGTVNKAFFWREGSFMLGAVRVTLGSTSTMGTEPIMDVPDGESIDTNIFDLDNSKDAGGGVIADSGTGWFTMGVVTTATGLRLRSLNAASTSLKPTTITATVPMTWTTSDAFDFNFKIPISGWSAGALLSTTQANLETISALYEISAGTANLSFADNAIEVIDLDTKIEDTHNAVTTGASWIFTAPRDGIYDVSASFSWSSNTNLDGNFLAIFKNASTEAVLVDTRNNDFSDNGSMPIKLSKDDTIDIRLRQDDSASAARSLSTGGTGTRVSIISKPNRTSFSVFGENEFLAATSSVKTPGASGDWMLMTGNSIILTPGSWLLNGNIFFGESGSAVYTLIQGLWATANGADTSSKPAEPTLDAGGTTSDGTFMFTGSPNARILVMNTVRITVTSNTTIFLVPRASMTTAANSRVTANIFAERIQ